MAVVFFAFCLFLTFKSSKQLSKKQKIVVSFWYLLAIIGMFIYTKYLINIGWEYGIPGADMRNYFNAALALNNGAKWTELETISSLYFVQVKLGTFMYFAFSSFVAILLWIPVCNYQVSLYFIYASFLLLCIVSSVNVSKIFGQEKSESRYLYTTLFCFGLMFAAYRLLRDTLLFYLITLTLLYIKKHRGKFVYIIISILLMLLCVVMRPYALFIILPYFIMHYSKSKRALIYVILIPILLIFVNGIFTMALPYFNVTWELSTFDLSELINFLFFPNIISQTQLLRIWGTVNHYSDYVAGCNLPGMYYAMSLWNFIVYPLTFIGFVYKFKDRFGDRLFWGSVLISVCAVYSILYSSESGLETRHKIMILIPLVYFAGEGIELLRKFRFGKCRFNHIYTILMLILAAGVFIVC